MPAGDDVDGALRANIDNLLRNGLATQWTTRAYTSETVDALRARLQGIAAADLESRLCVAGFTLRPYESEGIAQACESCMYFLIHRKYCSLPELELPVEPQWSCVLWRI